MIYKRKVNKLISLALICSLLLTLFSFQPITNAYAATPSLDSYVNNITIKKLIDGRYEAKYTVLKNRVAPSYEKITIGYGWPTSYRGSVPAQTKEINYTIGTHTMYFEKPANSPGWITFAAIYSSTYTSERKQLNQFFNTPSTSVNTQFRTISSLEANSLNFAFWAAPAIYLQFATQTAAIKWIGGTYLGWTLYSDFAATNNYNLFPKPAVGHYYKIDTWYSSSGILYTRTQVWRNQNDYNIGSTPLYNGTVSYTFLKN